MTACNVGDIKLKNVSMVDYVENYDDVYFTTLNLEKNTCKDFNYQYYPTEVNTKLTFSDRLNAVADAILNLGSATATTNATCGLCPN